jgi:hypothetical protein
MLEGDEGNFHQKKQDSNKIIQLAEEE